MPRKKLIRSNCLPYHVTARGNNREMFACGLGDAWRVFSENLKTVEIEYESKIHAFVLMPNHFHLLITTPKDDIGVVMQKFIASVTKTINFKSGRSGRVFGARYHWSLIENKAYFDYVMKYIYRNPIKANLCSRVDEYFYSTLKEKLHSGKLEFSISPHPDQHHLVPNNNTQMYLEWLNEPFPNEQEAAVREGLKRSRFCTPKKGWARKTVKLA